MVLHNQIDGLFSSLKERATHDGMVEGTSEGSPVHVGVNKDPKFKIVIVGDSTMQVKFEKDFKCKVLCRFLSTFGRV